MARPLTGRITREKDRWAWEHDFLPEKTVGEDLVKLSPADERALGKRALQLYMELERARGWDGRWFDLCLKDLALALGMAYRTAKWALRRLREAGLVKTRPVKGMVELKGGQFIRRDVGLQFFVWGTWQTVKGVREIWIPPRDWDLWKRPNPVGRPKIAKIYSCPLFADSAAASVQNHSGGIELLPPIDTDHYLSKTEQPLVSKLKKADAVETESRPRSFLNFIEEERRDRGEVPLAALQQPPKDPEPAAEETPAALDDLFASFDKAQDSGGRAKPVPTQTPVLPPLDPLPTTVFAPSIMVAGFSKPYYAMSLVSAYRQGVQANYDGSSFAYRTVKDIEKLPVFPALVSAAEFLVEHEIPPRAWAEWMIGKLKKRHSKPPPIKMVFNLSLLTKWRGWFWREYDYQSSVCKPAKHHFEQLYRRREAVDLARGLPLKLILWTKPKWYADMRSEEIKMGYADPLALYPRKPRRGK